MKTRTLLLSALGLAGAFDISITPVWAKHGVLLQVKAEAGTHCHLKFPAIREETLSWASPVLKDAASGDIIDFYGPCDYDPHGKDAVQTQKQDEQRRIRRDYNNE